MKRNRKSIRLRGYNYASDGAYFITICTKDREHFFGHIVNGEQLLNEIGKIVSLEWENTVNIRKDVTLGEFVIMPNHFHGIVNIGNPELPMDNKVYHRLVIEDFTTEFKSPSKTLGAIIRGFKGALTKRIKILGFENFAWHRNYYERIIRNQQELINIENYIKNNPLKWNEDEYFKLP